MANDTFLADIAMMDYKSLYNLIICSQIKIKYVFRGPALHGIRMTLFFSFHGTHIVVLLSFPMPTDLFPVFHRANLDFMRNLEGTK